MLKLRKADTSDCDILFNWRNDPLAIQYSLSGQSVAYAEHEVWFKRTLNSSSTILLIASLNNKPCGQIRFDKENANFVISFSIDKDHRGQGLAAQLLKSGVDYCSSDSSERLSFTGIVALNNQASCKAFLRAGFVDKEHKILNNKQCVIFSYILN
jgi:UDP-2,4-diacetamido-2,4,6-trideoxy-beta-L-altropyranose hydrolase